MKKNTNIGKSKWDLDTPCLVLDYDLFTQNLAFMQSHVAAHGKRLRPHAKTHKCSNIARLQMGHGSIGICAAKISEARALIGKGLKRVLITSPVVTGHKIKVLMDCARLAPEITLVVDNQENINKLAQAARASGLKLNVLVDLNPGMGRTGVEFSGALKLGEMAASMPALRLLGIQCYAGQVQHIASYQTRRETSRRILRRAADVCRQFLKAGLPCGIFTGAGTGTYDIDISIPELTDLQAGSYVFMDAAYLGIGSAKNESRFEDFKPALTLLTSVVSANQPGFVTVDAGLKALYREPVPPYVLNPAGVEWRYEWFGDEHGRLAYKGRPKIKLGGVFELVVSHCDPTVNLFDEIYVASADRIIDAWQVDLRGKCQ